MLKELEWEPLQERRQEARLAMLNKVKHDLIDIPKEVYVLKDSNTRSRFSREDITNNTYDNTFFPITITDPNMLLGEIIGTTTLEDFRCSIT